MILRKVYEKLINYTKALRLVFTAHPLIIRRADKVYKITLRPAAIKQLNKEVRNTELVSKGDIYADSVVLLKKVTPFAATSTLIKEKSTDSREEKFIQKQGKLIEICMENWTNTLRATRKPAFLVINSQINNLELDLKKGKTALHSQFSDLFCSNYFEYQVPVTSMHGDFSPYNSLIKEEKLFLIDWEYALHEGSIIYDWWYLKYSIDRHKIYNNDTKSYFSFIERSIEKIDLCYDKFNAFGYAMYTVIELSRLGTRKNADKNRLKKYLSELNAIITKFD